MKIAIVGDTSHDLNFELCEKYDIKLVSYYINMDDQVKQDLVDISSEEFYNKVADTKSMKTAVPSVQEGLDLFEDLKSQGYTDVVCIASSQKLTGMIGMYNTAKSMVEGINIYPYDSNEIASSAGLKTIEASRLAKAGKTPEEIISALDDMKNEVKIYASFKTLTYLVRGGRLSKAKGAIGNMLNINPILTLTDGEIDITDKVRGEKKSLKTLVSKLEEYLGDCKEYNMTIFEGNDPESYTLFKESIKDLIDNAKELNETKFTSVIGVHTGPQVVGASIHKIK